MVNAETTLEFSRNKSGFINYFFKKFAPPLNEQLNIYFHHSQYSIVHVTFEIHH